MHTLQRQTTLLTLWRSRGGQEVPDWSWKSADWSQAAGGREQVEAIVTEEHQRWGGAEENKAETSQPYKARQSSERCFTIMLHWRTIIFWVKEDYTGLNRSSAWTRAFPHSLIWRPYGVVLIPNSLTWFRDSLWTKCYFCTGHTKLYQNGCMICYFPLAPCYIFLIRVWIKLKSKKQKNNFIQSTCKVCSKHKISLKWLIHCLPRSHLSPVRRAHRHSFQGQITLQQPQVFIGSSSDQQSQNMTPLWTRQLVNHLFQLDYADLNACVHFLILA